MEKTTEYAYCGLSVRTVIQQDAVADQLAQIYKALGDPTRIRILMVLAEKELCVHDLAQLLGMTHSAISHQLQVLRDLHIVRYTKSGRHVFYALDDDHVAGMLELGLAHVCHG
ncbi:MAG: metalloregulator ArsR/SmtB family transcription factor [Anaerolineae bacterium]|nr:metalloregulator ArsR/SmtB family transcription factor [Anaerolineae bacterium]